MVLHKKLFASEQLSGKVFETTWKLQHEKLENDIWLLILTEPDNSNLLEFVTSGELYRMEKRELNPVIVGIAEDKDQAMEVARVIVDTVYQETNDVNIKAYFA